jgi:hypothetical protein
MTHTPVPSPVIILFPTAATGYLRRVDRPWPSPRPPKLPRRSRQPIPTFDRRALRERVVRLLKDTEQQRNGLKACFQ